jgi:hypothetical protein
LAFGLTAQPGSLAAGKTLALGITVAASAAGTVAGTLRLRA